MIKKNWQITSSYFIGSGMVESVIQKFFLTLILYHVSFFYLADTFISQSYSVHSRLSSRVDTFNKTILILMKEQMKSQLI